MDKSYEVVIIKLFTKKGDGERLADIAVDKTTNIGEVAHFGATIRKATKLETQEVEEFDNKDKYEEYL